MHRSRESVTPTIQGSGDISMCIWNIPTTSFVVDSSAPICWGHSFGPRSYPTGLSIPEAITMTFSFFRSDKLVYTNTSLRPISPYQPTQAVAGPVFSYLWNPHPTFPGRVHEFYELGCPDTGFPDFGFWTRSVQKLINTLEFKGVIFTVSVLRGHQPDRYRQHYSSSLYQQTGWDPFPYPFHHSPA